MSKERPYHINVDRNSDPRNYAVLDGSRLVVQTSNRLMALFIQHKRYKDGYSIPQYVFSASTKDLREWLGLDPID